MDSWKAIADYLGRDRTTVMRWERTAGLPVKRVAGLRGLSVFAYKPEIDQWLSRQASGSALAADEQSFPQPSEPNAPRASRFRWFGRATGVAAGLGLLVLLAAGLALMLGWGISPKVAKASLLGEDILAFDANGRQLWAHRLPHFDGATGTSGIKVMDLDFDGRPEIVAALRYEFRNGGEGYGQVLVLDDNGRQRWEHRLDVSYRFGDVEYGPGWFPDDLLVYRSGGKIRIAVAQHHHTWWPDVVTTYDSVGRLVGQFVNAGWITRLNVTADGRYLLAAGVNNSLGGPSLAILDAAAPSGASPAEGGMLPACANCPAGFPHKYFVAPWSDLARPSEMPFVGIVQTMADGIIQWRAAQRPVEHGKAPEVIITLSPTFEIRQRRVDDYFAETHALLERTASVRHISTDCRHPLVREWTSGRGWREIH